MASIVPSTTSSEPSTPVSPSSATRRPSLHKVIIPSAEIIARNATPTTTGGHGHTATPPPETTEDTPGHGHPAGGSQAPALLVWHASPYHSAASPTHPRMSARATRMNNSFSASSVASAEAPPAGVMTPPLEEQSEGPSSSDEDDRLESAESSRASSVVDAPEGF